MVGIYKNITTNSDDVVTTLIPIGANSGNIKTITIANNDTDPAINIDVYIEDAGANKYYYISNVNIPSGVSLVLNDDISFNSRVYALKILTNQAVDNTAPNISVIVK